MMSTTSACKESIFDKCQQELLAFVGKCVSLQSKATAEETKSNIFKSNHSIGLVTGILDESVRLSRQKR